MCKSDLRKTLASHYNLCMKIFFVVLFCLKHFDVGIGKPRWFDLVTAISKSCMPSLPCPPCLAFHSDTAMHELLVLCIGPLIHSEICTVICGEYSKACVEGQAVVY